MEPKAVAQSRTEPTESDLIGLSNIAGNASDPNHQRTSSSSAATSDTSDGDDFFHIDPLGFEGPNPPQSNFIAFDQNQAQPDEIRPSPSPPFPPTTVRNDVPDPNRIPSSVFNRTKSTSPMEWSVASNESLFSIHMGNASFSRDNVFLIGRPGVDPYESNPTPPLSPMEPPFPVSFPPPLSPMRQPISPLPPIAPPSTSKQATTLEARHGLEQPGAVEKTNAEAMTDTHELNKDKYGSDKEKAATEANPFAKSVSRQSEGSNASFQSFAFPILNGDGDRSGSIKIEPEHQRMQANRTQQEQPEQQTPKLSDARNTNAMKAAQPAAEEKGCLSCFSCCCC